MRNHLLKLLPVLVALCFFGLPAQKAAAACTQTGAWVAGSFVDGKVLCAADLNQNNQTQLPASNILKYIPVTEWPAIYACTSTYDVTAAKDSADQAVSINTSTYTIGHGEVDWPAGCYFFAGRLHQRYTVLEKGTSSGYAAGGSSVWKFPASTGGIVIEGANLTNCAASTTSSSGQGTQLVDITMIGGGGSPDTTSHGVWLCVTAELKNVKIKNFAGDGIHVADNGAGNANSFRIDYGFIENVGRYGILEVGSNSNAGLILGTQISAPGGGCDEDLSFLGNTHIGELCQSGGQGLVRVNSSGISYTCLDPACPSTTPAGNTTIWDPITFSAGYPAYSAGQPYLIGSDFAATNVNNRSAWYGNYCELGTPTSDPKIDIRGPGLAGAGDYACGYTTFTTVITVAGFDGSFIASQTGFGGVAINPGTGNTGIEAVVGGGSYANGTVVRSQNSTPSVITGSYQKHWIGASCDLYDDWDGAEAGRTEFQTGDCTGLTFGRAAAQPNKIAFPGGFWLSANQDNGDARWVAECTVMPASGSYATGDRCFNSAPTVLGSGGSQYVVTGWIRLTTGSGNVLNVDWREMRALTGT